MTLLPMRNGANPDVGFDGLPVAFNNNPVAAALARPNDAFIWGAGGSRLSPDDIARRRAIADEQTRGDYSPVEHWTQGLGRVLDGFTGGLEQRRLSKAEAANTAARGSEIAALLGDGNGDLAGGFASADPVVQAVAEQVLRSRMPKQAAPSIQRANNGDIIGIDPMTGSVLFTRPDPNPKPVFDWLQVKDPATGITSLVPVGPNGPIMEGGDPVSGSSGGALPPTSPGGMPDWWSTFTPEEQAVIMKQGQSRLGSHVPSGNPTSPPKTLPPDFDFGDGR